MEGVDHATPGILLTLLFAAWLLFRELEPKMIVGDEQIFRELKDRFGSPYGFGVYFRGGMGAAGLFEAM